MRPIIKRTSRAYVVLEHKDEVLVIRNWLSKQDWQLPGGGIKRGEKPGLAAARELYEELKVKVKPSDLRLVSEGRWRADNLSYHFYIFRVKCSSKPLLSRSSLEIIDARWLKRTKLNSNNTNPQVLKLYSRKSS